VWTEAMLRAARAQRYRQRMDLRINTPAEALAFVNQVGMCLLFSAKGIELPTLYGALCGQEKAPPAHHNERELGLAWQWKDDLPIAGDVLYGKFLKRKPVFISLRLAPAFYALSGSYGELDDFRELYQDAKLTAEARQVAEALFLQGALPTSELRRAARLAGEDNMTRFDRALAELQMKWQIVKTGISDTNAWKYCYIYDLLPRRFPSIPAAARQINSTEAMSQILTVYLNTVLVASPTDICRLFDWETWRLEQIVTRLHAQGRLQRDVTIEGRPGKYLQGQETIEEGEDKERGGTYE